MADGGGHGGGADFGDIFGGGNPQDIFANLFGGAGMRRASAINASPARSPLGLAVPSEALLTSRSRSAQRQQVRHRTAAAVDALHAMRQTQQLRQPLDLLDAQARHGAHAQVARAADRHALVAEAERLRAHALDHRECVLLGRHTASRSRAKRPKL